jgi:alkylmercury lyase
VISAAGLSIEPDRHRILLEGREFWTWCAYDVLGIFGALAASGKAYSVSPATGAALEVAFAGGRPEATDLVLFRPQDRPGCCSNAYEEWCPNSNFFEEAEYARRWTDEHSVSGNVLGLTEATELAARSWMQLSAGLEAK